RTYIDMNCCLTRRSYDLNGGVAWPTKYGTNCTMPALTKSRFGSSAGNGTDGTTVCPFASKCATNLRLISAVFIAELRPHPPVQADRKSTRLNSSHVKSSY